MKNQMKIQTLPVAIGTMATRLFIMSILLVLCFLSRAQDRITLMDGSELVGKVTEIGPDRIKYKKFTTTETIPMVVAASEVFMITYENGVREVISNRRAQTRRVVKNDPDEPETHVKFAGPRIGMTFISEGTMQQRLAERGKSPIVTQFGWQFEKRIFSFDGGPCGMFEFVPLVGGMEQGLFLPSASFLIGVRGENGPNLELALGPNVSMSGLGMVFAFGTNFKYKNVNFPVNIAYVPSVSNVKERRDPVSNHSYTITEYTGHRISIVVGFNVRKT